LSLVSSVSIQLCGYCNNIITMSAQYNCLDTEQFIHCILEVEVQYANPVNYSQVYRSMTSCTSMVVCIHTARHGWGGHRIHSPAYQPTCVYIYIYIYIAIYYIWYWVC